VCRHDAILLHGDPTPAQSSGGSRKSAAKKKEKGAWTRTFKKEGQLWNKEKTRFFLKASRVWKTTQGRGTQRDQKKKKTVNQTRKKQHENRPGKTSII